MEGTLVMSYGSLMKRHSVIVSVPVKPEKLEDLSDLSISQ
jgi:hypothetical protein